MQSNSSKIEFDNATLPQNASNEFRQYYQEHLKEILDSHSSKPQLIDDNESLTASDSDFEVEEYPQNIANQNYSSSPNKSDITAINDNLHNKLQNINSVGIKTSSDVHFGVKNNYHGPVTIKQFLVNDNENAKRKKSDIGIINKSFDGLSSNNTTQNEICAIDTHINVSEKKIKKQKPADANVTKEKKFLRNVKLLIVLVAVLCLLLIIIPLSFTIFPFYYYEGDFGDENVKGNFCCSTNIFLTEPPTTTEIILTTEEPFKMISRAEWNAKDSVNNLTKLNLPVSRVIIGHTITDDCNTTLQCTRQVQSIQNYHIEQQKFSDIGYNFLIGGDGNIYEGRGWNIQGAHTGGHNADSIGLAYMGTFTNKLPNKLQLDAGERLFNEGLKIKALREDFKIYGASQLRPTLNGSPGEEFMKLIMTWPRWTEY